MEVVWGMLGWRRIGGEAHGGTPSNHLGCKSKEKKINNIKYFVVFGSHRLTPYHTTTNQKHASVAKASVERRFSWAGTQGRY